MLCRSSKTADLIKDEIGSLLKVPNSTRWNPVFDAVARLVQMFETRNKLNGLNRVCNTLKVPPLKDKSRTNRVCNTLKVQHVEVPPFTSGNFTLKQIFLKSPSECYKI